MFVQKEGKRQGWLYGLSANHGQLHIPVHRHMCIENVLSHPFTTLFLQCRRIQHPFCVSLKVSNCAYMYTVHSLAMGIEQGVLLTVVVE